MRLKINLTLAVLATVLSSFYANAQQTAKVTSSGIGYLEYLPDGYKTNLNKYPVVISLHGIKERGSNTWTVANVGLPKYVKYGAKYPFILISPQLKSSYSRWPASYVMDVINYVKKTLRVDERRIYLTGLSLGGWGVWTTVAAYPQVFAAIAPVCPGGSALSSACTIAKENVAIWGFHGDRDGIVSYSVTTKMIAAVNACSIKPNPLAKATIFAGMGHSVWDKAYKETNVLNWMLTFTNGTTTSSTTTTNDVPVANAGADITKTLPTSSATCYGNGTDSDGTIASFSWSQVSGPSVATLTNKTTKTLTASSLREGTYYFRLKVTDNKGAYDNDDVKVVIQSGTTTSTNSSPVVSAGSDKTLYLPTNYANLPGTASDSDGSIVSYTWAKLSGGRASMKNTTSPTAYAYNLDPGTYVFRLTVKDNKGAVKYDDVKLYVK